MYIYIRTNLSHIPRHTSHLQPIDTKHKQTCIQTNTRKESAALSQKDLLDSIMSNVEYRHDRLTHTDASTRPLQGSGSLLPSFSFLCCFCLFDLVVARQSQSALISHTRTDSRSPSSLLLRVCLSTIVCCMIHVRFGLQQLTHHAAMPLLRRSHQR